MRTRAALLAAALLAGGALASPSLAAPPESNTKAPRPIGMNPDPVTFEACGGVTFEALELVNKERFRVISETPDGMGGSARITGALKLQITNVETGQSIVVNASGPGTVSGSPTVTRFQAQGRSLIFPNNEIERAQLLAIAGSDLLLTKGPIDLTTTFAFDPESMEPPVPLTATGTLSRNVTDLCPSLT